MTEEEVKGLSLLQILDLIPAVDVWFLLRDAL